MKILIVEDDEMNRTMLARRIAYEGYNVVEAVNGAQAILRARSERPNLILMDIGLPVLNGWQATQRIKMDPQLESIPIIALTAFATESDRVQSMALGCDDYETKPIAFDRLLKKIHKLLSS